MCKARAVVMAGKLPSAVRSVGFGDCGRSVAACDAGKPAGAAGSATRSQAQGEKNALRGAPARRARQVRARPPALATCAAWRALAWPLLEPADAPGGTLGTLFRTEAHTGPSQAGPGVRLWHIKLSGPEGPGPALGRSVGELPRLRSRAITAQPHAAFPSVMLRPEVEDPPPAGQSALP